MAVKLGDRTLFPKLGTSVYWNHASVSPPSVRVEQAIHDAVALYASEGLDAAIELTGRREELREQLAILLDTDAANLAFVANTTSAVISVAHCLRWRAHDRVLLFRGEFPTNVTPWQSAARQHQLELVFLDADLFRTQPERALEQLQKELAQGVRLVAASSVQFQTGFRMPIATLGELAHEHGAQLFVDAIQSLGSVPLSLQREPIDFLACGSHKWLMGLEGAGVLYVHPDALSSLEPRLVGWRSHADAFTFLTEGAGELRYDRPLEPSIRFLEAGTPNTIGYVALLAAVECLVALTPAAIHRHVQEILDLLEQGLVERGFESLRAAAAAGRSCILALRPPPGLALRDLYAELRRAGVVCTIPDGILRFSPHWPNSRDQVELALSVLDDKPG